MGKRIHLYNLKWFYMELNKSGRSLNSLQVQEVLSTNKHTDTDDNVALMGQNTKRFLTLWPLSCKNQTLFVFSDSHSHDTATSRTVVI